MKVDVHPEPCQFHVPQETPTSGRGRETSREFPPAQVASAAFLLVGSAFVQALSLRQAQSRLSLRICLDPWPKQALKPVTLFWILVVSNQNSRQS